MSRDFLKGHTSFRALQKLAGVVLVVDDELHSRLYLRKLLEARGCTVIEAENGSEGLVLAGSRLPDLILVDVMMPGMDGFELCGRLQAEARTTDIPVIMVTAKSKIEDLELGFELGAMDYIRKPFNPRELVLRVGNALALKKSNDTLTIWNNRVARDLELAGSIQRSLFSDMPRFTKHFEARIAYRSSMDVGGDAFDIISLPDGKYCVYIADVCGHGVAPAMISSLIKAAVNEIARRYADRGPHVICNSLNAMIRDRIDNPSYFTTLFLAIYNPETNIWRGLSCGHPNPIIVKDGHLLHLNKFKDKGSVPIGFPFGEVRPYTRAQEVSFSGEGNIHFLLYTDGLTDAHNVERDKSSDQRMATVYESLTRDSLIVDKAVGLIETLNSEHFALNEDDCTAISIHMLQPENVLIDQLVAHDIQVVASVSKKAEMLACEHNISESNAAKLRLLIMELGANLVHHGGLEEDELFWVQLRVDQQNCQLVIIDTGGEWEPDYVADDDDTGEEDKYRGRGRGLAISDTVTDHMERYRVSGQNVTYCVINGGGNV